MHKFQPRVYLVRRKDGDSSSVTDIEREEFRSFVFPETQFTAVTAYQNQLVSFKRENLNLGLGEKGGSIDYIVYRSPLPIVFYLLC